AEEVPAPAAAPGLLQQLEGLQGRAQAWAELLSHRARAAFADLHDGDLGTRARNWLSEQMEMLKQKFQETFPKEPAA
ncbi:apolipoprotein C-I-like, partial [Apteryx rowi]